MGEELDKGGPFLAADDFVRTIEFTPRFHLFRGQPFDGSADTGEELVRREGQGVLSIDQFRGACGRFGPLLV